MRANDVGLAPAAQVMVEVATMVVLIVVSTVVVDSTVVISDSVNEAIDGSVFELVIVTVLAVWVAVTIAV